MVQAGHGNPPKKRTTLVIKNVPAEVCGNCGEEYVAEDTTTHLLKTAEDIARVGVEVDIRKYVAA